MHSQAATGLQEKGVLVEQRWRDDSSTVVLCLCMRTRQLVKSSQQQHQEVFAGQKTDLEMWIWEANEHLLQLCLAKEVHGISHRVRTAHGNVLVRVRIVCSCSSAAER